MAWNDIVANTDAALPGTIISCWSGAPHASFTVANATALGYVSRLAVAPPPPPPPPQCLALVIPVSDACVFCCAAC
jgi:hypothetical protein